MESPKLTINDKAAIMGENARRFFKLGNAVPLQRTSSLHGTAV